MGFFSNICELIKGSWYKTKNFTVQHAPEICFGAGVTLLTVGVGMTIYKSVKPNEELVEARKELEAVEEFAKENLSDEADSIYTTADYKREKNACVLAYAGACVHNYAFSVGTCAASALCFTGSFLTFKRRDIGYGVALATTAAAFNGYRQNVRERFGEEVDKELLYNLNPPKEVIDEATGEVTYELPDGLTNAEPETFTRFFDAGSKWWDKNPEIALLTIKLIERNLNDDLRKKGALVANDACDAYDVSKSKKGAFMGWIYNPEIEHQIVVEVYHQDKYIEKYSDLLGPDRELCLGDNVFILHFNATDYVPSIWPDVA